jgi:hypothetical protein
VLAAILQRAPRTTLLVTTRQRLHLQGERVVEVEGLPYPPDLGERAARLMGAAETLRAANGALVRRCGLEDSRKIVAEVRTLLDEASFAAAWAEGQSLSVEQVVADALTLQLLPMSSSS